MKTTRILALVASLVLLLASSVGEADTTHFYPHIAQTSPGASSLQMSSVELLRFLVEGVTVDCPGCTGPGWTLTEAYSNAGRCVPVTPTDVDSMVSCAAWKGDGSGLGNGDWFVVESADSSGGGGANHFQVLVEYNAPTSWKFVMMPLAGVDGWEVGTATPDAAGSETRVGSGSALVTYTTQDGASDLDIVADQDVVIIRRDDATAVDLIYIGAVEGNLATSTPADDRPFVIMDTPASVWFRYYSLSSDYWNRLAPDDVTVLVKGAPGEFISYNVYVQETVAFPATYNGSYQLLPVPIVFHDIGHLHVTGFLQHLRAASVNAGLPGRSLGGKTWTCRSNGVGYAVPCLRWDGITVYP